MLAGFVIDLAFVGANGISREHGLTTPDPAVADVKAQAIRAARRRVFAGVHTKFGVRSFCRFAEIADFESLVTDTGIAGVRGAPLLTARPAGHPGLNRYLAQLPAIPIAGLLVHVCKRRICCAETR